MSIIVRRNGGQYVPAPFYHPLSLFNEMDRLRNETWDSWRPFAYDYNVAPSTDVYEEEGQLVIKSEIPGIKKDDLDITLEGDRLTIKAEKKEEVKEDATHHSRERYYGQYYRSVTLPYPVKENKINAIFDNGVLELRLPKAEEVKAKKIEIKAELPEAKQEKPKRVCKQKTS